MNVGECVRKAIDDIQAGELESAMLHACNAIDGTAKKIFPTQSVGKRFKRVLRSNYDVLGPFGIPGVDIVQTRFSVPMSKPDAPGGGVDLADLIYGIHRCCHAHGEDLPQGFQLIPDIARGPGVTSMIVTRGTLAVSDRMICALLAVAIFSPVNLGQIVPVGYHLTLGTRHHFEISQWWGQHDVIAKICAIEMPTQVPLDFGDWNSN